MRTVLVIDDNPAVAEALTLLFGLYDIRTLAAATPARGLEVVASERVDLVIADMNFSADTTSGDEGVALFRALRAQQPDLPVILLTAWTHLEAAVQLVKAGAADYIGKPWDNDKLLATLENLLELSETTRERRALQETQRRRRARLAAEYDLRNLVFASDAMERAVELACRVARADVRVLITGPNGAGKERIAEILHANSTQRDGPLVAINCGAIPAELIEAELFGAEAGAYTGATRARAGRFELADEGTLFLDEIGELPLAGQVKLLRVLETGQFQMLGSSKTRTARVRVVSATNADLSALIREGRFREDLYYRLNVIEISVPPLTERRADILPLARHFLGDPWRLTEDAEAALLAHDWPGNVRELRNSIERAKLLGRDHAVTAADLNLPAPHRAVPDTETQRRAADPVAGRGEVPGRTEAEEPSRELIEACLRESGGNISRAAQSLGLSRQALYRRMERFNLRP
jgi:DNA-binding NtrC family response regulator